MQNIPDEKKCRQLMTQYAMLPNIVQHCYRVCQIALFLGKAINQKKAGLDLELIKAAALLHDITKTRSLKTKENHAKTGEKLLADLGYPQVGKIVGRHVLLKEENSCSPLNEIHIVNHADRRVLHEKVVSIEERFSYLVERYGRTAEIRQYITLMQTTALKLETIIFNQLKFSPNDLLAFNALPASDWNTIPQGMRL